MNVKKQLNKIAEYIKEIEEVNQILNVRLARYENNNEQELHISGNFCGDVMEKMVDNVWQPIEHEHPEYAKVVDENARLREALRWHPVSEKPKNDERYSHCNISVDVLFRINDKTKPIIVWHNADSNSWVCDGQIVKTYNDSKWCYIPEDN